jgi:hypothetical protein
MLLAIAVRILESIFVVGMLGCVLVLLLTTVEDIRTLFDAEEKKPPEPAATPQ